MNDLPQGDHSRSQKGDDESIAPEAGARTENQYGRDEESFPPETERSSEAVGEDFQ